MSTPSIIDGSPSTGQWAPSIPGREPALGSASVAQPVEGHDASDPSRPLIETTRPRIASSAWQWVYRKRPAIAWDHRAIEILRLGHFTTAVLLRLVDECIPDFERMIAVNGINLTRRVDDWARAQSAFWSGQFATRLKAVGSATYELFGGTHPALPGHLISYRIKLLCVSDRRAFATQPTISSPVAAINLSVGEFSLLQNLRTANPQEAARLRAGIATIVFHEAAHAFNAGATRRYTRFQDDAEAYANSPEEVFAHAVSTAVHLLCRSPQVPRAEALGLLSVPSEVNPATYYLKTARYPGYAKRHPACVRTVRKFDWLFSRYYDFFAARWEAESKAAQQYASQAW